MKVSKSDQLNLRISPDDKKAVNDLAKLLGVSVSGLLLGAVLGDLAGDVILQARENLKSCGENKG